MISSMMRQPRVLGLTFATGLLLHAGCQSSPFPKDAPRTQYDRYAQLRGRQRAMTQTNSYGREERPLRERLAPLGDP